MMTSDPEQEVGIGSIIHHVNLDTSECTAAIVTRTYPQAENEPVDLGSVGIVMFPWADGVENIASFECQEKPIPGTWHWPERCPR